MPADEPMPAPSAERERICQALVDLCFEHGYSNTTLPMLLERAAVDLTTFERHFADVEDCFCQVYIELRDEFLLSVRRAVADQLSWRDRLRAAAYAMVRHLLADERVAQFGVFEVRTAGERAQMLPASGKAAHREKDR